jgi:transcriptional regulator with XRE-family HTH domain
MFDGSHETLLAQPKVSCDYHRKAAMGLRDLRKQRGWTLEAVAFLAQRDQATISRIERGLVEPSPETTVALARTFGISIERLRRLLAEAGTEKVSA